MIKIKNGKFELAGTEWTVLEDTEQGKMCISDSIGDMVFGETNNWTPSDLREYLNTKYLKKIEEIVGAENIIEFERNLLSLDGQTEYGTCRDKVSLISAFEYIEHRKLLPNTGDWFWTLTADSTPCNNEKTWVAIVSPSGGIDCNGCRNYCRGVRPVCILKSNIFVSKGEPMAENREHKPTQCDRILKYICDFGSISTWEAMMDLGVARLASRIFDLKEKGYQFRKQRVHTNNRYGQKCYYDRYFLVKENA